MNLLPESIFLLMLWAAIGVVTGAAIWLLVALIREWKQGCLW